MTEGYAAWSSAVHVRPPVRAWWVVFSFLEGGWKHERDTPLSLPPLALPRRRGSATQGQLGMPSPMPRAAGKRRWDDGGVVPLLVPCTRTFSRYASSWAVAKQATMDEGHIVKLTRNATLWTILFNLLAWRPLHNSHAFLVPP